MDPLGHYYPFEAAYNGINFCFCPPHSPKPKQVSLFQAQHSCSFSQEMAWGRGSASQAKAKATVALLLTLCLLVCLENIDAATYTVGDSSGWTFNMATWPQGKRFRAGDVLVFNYDSTIHNVVAVNRGGYTSCTTPASAKVYKSGKDQVKLAKGLNFFICNTAGHCESGMKIAINAV